ncbi:MAG TPA: hypothetical protein VMH02_02465 [Verrucomicrobiae bacterium]|nr:hypothetical protein [Verrucomicrobiae bacterium]
MIPRRLPGAAALGLLAALLAHGLLFGSGHAVGGSFHDALVTLGCVATVCLLAGFAALARAGAAHTADGSVLGVRLERSLPGVGGVFTAAALCFAGGESLEPPHADHGVLATLAALFVAAWLLRTIARAGVRAIAAIAIAVARVRFAAREPVEIVCSQPFVFSWRAPVSRRHFARPPPANAAFARA